MAKNRAVVGYARVSSVGQSIDTSEATGRLLFNMLGAIGQFETEIRAERQANGIAHAKANGVAFGRKRNLTLDQAEALRKARSDGALIRELITEHRLSKVSVYRYLAEPTDKAELKSG